MKEQRLLRNAYLYLHFCIWVLCYPTAVWCVYQAVLHHAVAATCLSTANWEVARVLCNGCCVYTHVHTVRRCLFCVHCSVESGTMYMWRTYVQYSTLCSVTYIQYMYLLYAIVHVHCVIVGVRYATVHRHCVIVGRYFFKKVHRYIVCTYTYIRMASCCIYMV